MNKLTKIWMIGFSLFLTCSLQAQISGYIQGDENYTLTLAFHKVDTLIVVTPHNYTISAQDKTNIESYVFWDQYQKKPVYVYKNETELTKKNLSQNLQFYGPFYDFKMDEVQNIPIKQVDGGFMFNHDMFTCSTDAFFYLNDKATRLYTCRNSTQALHPYTDIAAGYFQLYIFRDTELFLSGFCMVNTPQPRINYLMEMKQSYFEKNATRHFDFNLAKPICTDSLRQIIWAQSDNYLENLCTTLKTDTSDLERMTTYVYKNMTDLQQFLSMSPRMTIYGKSIGSVNHVSSFDMAVFKHELAHTVIGRKIGTQPNSFFCEGFAVYTGYFGENNNYASDLDSTKIHIDLLTEDIIPGPGHRFYSHPPLYPISGVFTRFVIDKIGMDAFKAIYARQNIINAFTEKGFPITELITEFKNTLSTETLKK